MKQAKFRNPEAKYARWFKKPAFQVNRKKATKAGYQKHKRQGHSYSV